MTEGWSRHDPAAVFYGGYDQVALRRPAPVHVRWTTVAIALATAVLAVLTAADVSAYTESPVIVRVTSVDWYAGTVLLTTSPGFSLRPSATTTFPLVCELFCVPWTGASVSAPFQIVNFTETATSVQYTNITVRAPPTAYDGSLTITLEIGSLTSSGPQSPAQR